MTAGWLPGLWVSAVKVELCQGLVSPIAPSELMPTKWYLPDALTSCAEALTSCADALATLVLRRARIYNVRTSSRACRRRENARASYVVSHCGVKWQIWRCRVPVTTHPSDRTFHRFLFVIINNILCTIELDSCFYSCKAKSDRFDAKWDRYVRMSSKAWSLRGKRERELCSITLW
jgi:hypothetical protein